MRILFGNLWGSIFNNAYQDNIVIKALKDTINVLLCLVKFLNGKLENNFYRIKLFKEVSMIAYKVNSTIKLKKKFNLNID